MVTSALRALLLACLSLSATAPALADPPEPRARLTHDGAITCLTFAPDGKLLAAGDKDGAVRLYQVASGKETRKLQHERGEVVALAFAPDSQTLASTATDGTVRLWDPATGKERHQRESPFAVSHIAFSRDGNHLVVADPSATVSFFDVRTMKETQSWKPKQPPRWLALHPDGQTLLLQSVQADKLTESGVRLSFTLRIMDLQRGTELRELTSIVANRLLLSPNGRTLAATWASGPVMLYELASGKELARLGKTSTACAFTPDGRFLISADASDDHVIHIHDLVAGKEVVRMEAHEAAVTALAVSPDGRTLASGGNDFTVHLWDLAVLDKKRPLPAQVLTDKELEARWQDLSNEDATRAFQARNALVRTPAQTLPLLKQRLHTALLVDPEKLARWLADLDSGDFPARQKATQELERLGDLAEPALQRILESKPSLEVRRRVEQLLARLDKRPLSPVQLQVVRGVEVLEVLGTPETRKLLDELARQTPQTLLTQEAQAALRRGPRR